MFPSTTTKTRRAPKSYSDWTPHKYQERATQFLIERGAAALFLDPGLGKTSIALNAFSQLHADGQALRMLVIAPLRVCQLVWRQEAAQWTQFRHLTFTFLHGPNKDDLLREDSEVYLINPEGVPWLVDRFGGMKDKTPLPFDTLVIDELTKFKNARAKRHKHLRAKQHSFRRRWGLTGTPTPNGYMDLFGQMLILDGGAALGKYITYFRQRYFIKGFDGFSWDLMRGADRQIEERIAPYVLRMSADDYLDMPPLIDNVIEIEMPPAARKQYDQMKRDTLLSLEEGTVTAANAAAVYSKLKQMANGAVYTTTELGEKRITAHVHDAKLEALTELVEELAGQPLLIAYEFQHDLERLKEWCRKTFKKELQHLGRGTTDRKAAEVEKAWNAGEIDLLAVHPASAGHGLNLQKGGAKHIAWFSATWDYELYDQLIRRLYRQGSSADRVINHLLLVKGTLDRAVINALGEKKTTQDGLLEALSAEILPEGVEVEAAGSAVKPEREELMVKKLKRYDEEPEEAAEAEEEESEEEGPPKGWGVDSDSDENEAPKASRTQRKSMKEKLRGEDKADDEDEDEDAPSLFSKGVQSRLAGDDESDESDEDDEEKPKTRKPARKKPSARRGATKEASGEGDVRKSEKSSPEASEEPVKVVIGSAKSLSRADTIADVLESIAKLLRHG